MMAFRFPSSPSLGRLPFCLLSPGRPIANPDVLDRPAQRRDLKLWRRASSRSIDLGFSPRKPPAEKTGFASRLTICLAKKSLDACGPGYDRWIAIEGDIDQDACGVMRGGDAGSEKPLARGPLAIDSLAARPHSQPQPNVSATPSATPSAHIRAHKFVETAVQLRQPLLIIQRFTAW
jgi:hypothetical protein